MKVLEGPYIDYMSKDQTSYDHVVVSIGESFDFESQIQAFCMVTVKDQIIAKVPVLVDVVEGNDIELEVLNSFKRNMLAIKLEVVESI